MKEKVWFENSNGDKLCAILSNPTDNKDKLVVIIAHGFSSSKYTDSYVLFEKFFNDKEISVFRFDFWGHGESEGTFEDITITEAVDDVKNSIVFLKKLGYSNIGLVGSSFGGMASILTSASSKDVKILGLRAPISDYLAHLIAKRSETEIDDWRKTSYLYWIPGNKKRPKGYVAVKKRLNYSFFEDSKKYDGHKEATKITIPTIIVHGAKDTTVPIEQSKQTSKEIKNCTLKVYPESDHWFSHGDDKEEAIKAIVDFFVEKQQKPQVNYVF